MLRKLRPRQKTISLLKKHVRCGKVKHKLRIQIHELRVQMHKLED